MKKISKKEITKIVKESITKTLEKLDLTKPSKNATKFLDKVAKTISKELNAEVRSAKKKLAKTEKAINKKLKKEEKSAKKKIAKAEKVIKKKILNAEANAKNTLTAVSEKIKKPAVRLTNALPQDNSKNKTVAKKKMPAKANASALVETKK